MKDVEIVIDVAIVFDISVTYMSSRFEPISKVYIGEPFMVVPNIKCLSPWPILIENTSFQLVIINCKEKVKQVKIVYKFVFQAEHIKNSSGGYQSVLNEVVLESDECASEIICITPSELSENVLGCFTINWKRYAFFC